MAYEPGAPDATLAAAAGNDAALFTELRDSFIASLTRQIDLLGRARCDGNWRIAALRIAGLADSFDAGSLRLLAEDAITAAPGDPRVVRRLHGWLDDYRATAT